MAKTLAARISDFMVMAFLCGRFGFSYFRHHEPAMNQSLGSAEEEVCKPQGQLPQATGHELNLATGRST
jgi:hypothetical protein